MRLRQLLQEFARDRAREERQAAKGSSGGGH
jgi:heme exporter protein D